LIRQAVRLRRFAGDDYPDYPQVAVWPDARRHRPMPADSNQLGVLGASDATGRYYQYAFELTANVVDTATHCSSGNAPVDCR
jgi:hypothetical protein